MSIILEKLFTAADNHGEDSGEPDHTVGDLQDALRCAWDIMTIAQKQELLASEEIDDIIMAGAQGEFDAEELIQNLREDLKQKEIAVTAAGYEFIENEHQFYWENDEEASDDFPTRDDAIVAAYTDLSEAQHTSKVPL